MMTNSSSPKPIAIMRALSGKVVTQEVLRQNGLELFHVSCFGLRLGSALDTAISTNHPHSVFFHEPIPVTCNADYLARRKVEYAFEEVRTSVNPDLPDRRTSLFASLVVHDAEQWCRKPSRRGGIIYKLSAMRDADIVVADYCWFNYAVRVAKGKVPTSSWIFKAEDTESEIATAAQHYWTGKCLEAAGDCPAFEALISGRVEIISIVEKSDHV